MKLFKKIVLFVMVLAPGIAFPMKRKATSASDQPPAKERKSDQSPINLADTNETISVTTSDKMKFIVDRSLACCCENLKTIINDLDDDCNKEARKAPIPLHNISAETFQIVMGMLKLPSDNDRNDALCKLNDEQLTHVIDAVQFLDNKPLFDILELVQQQRKSVTVASSDNLPNLVSFQMDDDTVITLAQPDVRQFKTLHTLLEDTAFDAHPERIILPPCMAPSKAFQDLIKFSKITSRDDLFEAFSKLDHSQLFDCINTANTLDHQHLLNNLIHYLIKKCTADHDAFMKKPHEHIAWIFEFYLPNEIQALVAQTLDRTYHLSSWISQKSNFCIQTLQGHTNFVTSVSFSPDGTTLASASWDNTIKLWQKDLNGSWICIQTLQGHANLIISINFSPDGTTLATASGDKTIKLWQKGSNNGWACIQTLQDHTDSITSVNFSPDGTILASASFDNTIKLWQKGSNNGWACIQTLQGHTSFVTSVSFSPDGTILASTSRDNTIKLWQKDLNGSRSCIQTLQGHNSWANSVNFSPDGTTLASASGDKTIKLWEKSSNGTWRCIQTLEGHERDIFSVSFGPDGTTLASTSTDMTIKLWQKGSNNGWPCIQTLQGHTSFVTSVSFSPDGATLTSASFDNTIKLWNLKAMISALSSLTCKQMTLMYFIKIEFDNNNQALDISGNGELIEIFNSLPDAVKEVLNSHVKLSH